MDDMPDDLEIGDPIVFAIAPPATEQSAPLATSVAKATGAAAEAILAKVAQSKGKGKGKGKG
eukprot:CAMPEP_0198527716 /NCGR_PEP_ID=MMETSP1462-20131121/24713_1 /TAXON_ID=1333877 /ORGANISM="Brandtodinium nutriculum, Strain RCC3387" /LENGTH=61 /DNA_ID=CAMNT_0044257527 /DNA_START=8 /DNA_END=190 /DNA_ORIENTATION=+